MSIKNNGDNTECKLQNVFTHQADNSYKNLFKGIFSIKKDGKVIYQAE